MAHAPFRHSVELPAGLSDRSLATFDEWEQDGTTPERTPEKR